MGAYEKLNNGIVQTIHSRCIGCGYCLLSCHYGAISKYRDGKAQKCNLCAERLERNEMPACVQGCPCDVLKIEDTQISDTASMSREMVGFSYHFTKPNIRFYPRIKLGDD